MIAVIFVFCWTMRTKITTMIWDICMAMLVIVEKLMYMAMARKSFLLYIITIRKPSIYIVTTRKPSMYMVTSRRPGMYMIIFMKHPACMVTTMENPMSIAPMDILITCTGE